MFLTHFLYSPRPSLCCLNVDIYQPKPVRALLSLLMGEVSLNIVRGICQVISSRVSFSLPLRIDIATPGGHSTLVVLICFLHSIVDLETLIHLFLVCIVKRKLVRKWQILCPPLCCILCTQHMGSK